MSQPKIYIKNCRFGLGVFAKRDIRAGEVILLFQGDIISKAAAWDHPTGNPLQISDDEYINIHAPAVLANHSCQPNAGIKHNSKLVALQNINQDEEIFYDYSTTMDEDHWTMPCDCRQLNCRHIIKDFKYIPKEIQNKYIALDIVQSFIKQKYYPRPIPANTKASFEQIYQLKF